MDIEELRRRRDLSKEIKIKPSPYLRDTYVDEYGEERPVVLRNYQKQHIIEMCMVPRHINGTDTGLGKAQPVDAKVLTLTGWVEIGSLKVRDMVVGSDGTPTRVRGVFPQGVKDVYKVTMSDGSSTECCDEHLWTVRTGNTRRFGAGWRVLPLKRIAGAGFMRQRNSASRRWSIPMVEPVRFLEKQLPVDPYLLGVLLGDGSMPGTITVSNGDPKLFDLIQARLPADCRLGTKRHDGITVGILGKAGVHNSLKKGLVELDLVEKNWTNKFIPSQYLTSSVAQRVDVLRGLMDTDGYVSKDGKVTQFYSSNRTLVDGFVHLVQSLGGTAGVKSKMPVLRGKSRAKNERLAYTVTVLLPNSIIPFSLPRKVARWRPRTKYLPIRYIAKVEHTRRVECVCISVEAEDDLYVTDNFIVTHNTIEVLSTIGYVWLKEPTYVPIVITKKSSLFQWEAEVRKFMKGMEAVTVDAPPHERAVIYEDFFLNYDPDRKRLIILTYDMLLKDTDETVIRDRTARGTLEDRKALKAVQKALRESRTELKEKFQIFKSHFNGRPVEFFGYVKARMALADPGADQPDPPEGWDEHDERQVTSVVWLRDACLDGEAQIKLLKDAIAPPVRVPGIRNLVHEMRAQNPDIKVMLVVDEIHVLKNYKGKMHGAAASLAALSDRVVGMTATPVKNRLMEFFGLYKLVLPSLFPKITHFQNQYCIVKWQKVSRNRKVPVVVGHSKAQLDAFVERIEPYYLSRRKHEVAKELPQLVTRELICELTDVQEELYDIAELGMLNKADDADVSPAEMLSSMVMVQQACNAPQLLMDEEGDPFEGPSSKLDILKELFIDELDGVKTIVFSRFERMITLIQKMFNEAGIRCVRITGKEVKARDRQTSMKVFQDIGSGVDVILITTAGSESINLQAAEHIVFVDSPWSAGDYLQVVGRAIRIGSTHKMVVVTHLVARRRNGKKTIDHYVLEVLRKKKRLMDKVAGDGLPDAFSFTKDVDDIFNLMTSERPPRASSKKVPPHLRKAPFPSAVVTDSLSIEEEQSDTEVSYLSLDLDSL